MKPTCDKLIQALAIFVNYKPEVEWYIDNSSGADYDDLNDTYFCSGKFCISFYARLDDEHTKILNKLGFYFHTGEWEYKDE